jgi:transposase
LSSQKRDQDSNNRQRRIEKSIHALDTLKQSAGTGRVKTKEQIAKAVSAVFEKYHSAPWFEWKIVPEHLTEYKQKGLGRPGKHTEYVKTIKERWTFEAVPNGSRIQEAAERDGIFPLLTNIPSDQLSTREVLLKYKYQPYIEKRHQQFKSVFNAAPVFLKTPHRIEALLFIYFIVLLVNALIERELRRSMKRQNIRTLPLYPEHRKCRFPTTTRILDLFANQSRHVLIDDGKVVKYF